VDVKIESLYLLSLSFFITHLFDMITLLCFSCRQRISTLYWRHRSVQERMLQLSELCRIY
jgi:hypothetical protein